MPRTRLRLLAALLLVLAAGGLGAVASLAAPGDKPGAGGQAPPKQPPQAQNPPAKPAEAAQGALVNNVSGFSSISLTGAGKVTVRQTGKESVSIQGDKALVQASSAKVENGVLVLTGGLGAGAAGALLLPAAGAAAPQALVEFVVEVKELRGVSLDGLGSVSVAQLDAKQLAVTVGGSGDVAVSGKAEALELSVTGTGNFEGYGLAAARATVRHLGTGRAVVNVARQLEVSIVGNGSVEYAGSPQVRQSILGLGAVTRKR